MYRLNLERSAPVFSFIYPTNLSFSEPLAIRLRCRRMA